MSLGWSGRKVRVAARRRVMATVVAVAATTVTIGTVVAPTAPAATYAAGAATTVARLTGPGSINDTPGRYNIYGTDLGTMWDNGKGEILAAFGDTQTFNGWSLLYGQLWYCLLYTSDAADE